MEVKLGLDRKNTICGVVVDDNEVEGLYQIYKRVQAGDKAALKEIFKRVDKKEISKLDELEERHKLSHMDNILDAEFVLHSRREKQQEEWIESALSNIDFRFSCLSKILHNMKKDLLFPHKKTGYENGKKIKKSGHSKFYTGKYDVSDFNELLYETLIEVFYTKTDENNCLTLDDKKNKKNPICDGVSLLQNICYYTSRKINKRERYCGLDIFDTGSYNEGSDMELTYFDRFALNEYLESEGGTSRLAMYAEFLEWIKRNDIYRLFKTNAYDIISIIETIMNRKDTFIMDANGDMKTGSGMCLIKQELLQKMINDRHNINIEQENISIDLRIIEQRLLDHLFYALNYSIGSNPGNSDAKSRRFLYDLDRKAYVKLFSRASYILYSESIKCISNNDHDMYFRIVKKYENMVMEIILSEKGKKKYDMVNLMLGNYDLVDDDEQTILNIADTIKSYYQNKEEGYKKNKLKDYKICSLKDWNRGFWEAILKENVLKIKLWSSENVKNPVRREIGTDGLVVYSGFVNYYFCDMIKKICYCVPKRRRIISRSNSHHEITMSETY